MADIQAGVVYLLNPSAPSSVKSFAVQQRYLPSGMIDDPAGVAISDAGIAYVTVCAQGGTGLHGFFKLDTNTGVVTDYQFDSPGLVNDAYLRTALSSDNTRAYFNDDGFVFSIDTATDTVFLGSAGQGCCYGDYDLTLAPNQIEVEGTSYLFDSDLNAQSFLSFNDRVIQDTLYVYGAKFSSDGSLLFQPATSCIDVFDAHIGTLRNRIALPFALSTGYDALVTDGRDDVLLAITGTNGNGIAVLDLTSLPEPPPLPYARSTADARNVSSSRHGIRPEDLRLSLSHKTGASAPLPRNRVAPHVTRSLLVRPK